jgi:tRNA (guanine37-N1)-methyltransferase
MSFATDIIGLHPELFPGPLATSIHGRALKNGIFSLRTTQLRDFATDRHKTVDDTPAGGGPGMVLKANVLAAAIDHVATPDDHRPRLLMGARGRPLDQPMVREFAAGPGLVIVCGRFEGVDERILDARRLTEISIGDFVLSGGEVAAMALLEAVIRLLPGVMGTPQSQQEESFAAGLLEYPQYTRPQTFEGDEIPPVLTSGDHGAVKKWRMEKARELTRQRRPDLWTRYSDHK